jgi:hypothetical protein
MHYLLSAAGQLTVRLETDEGEKKPEPTPAESDLFEATTQALENGMKLVGIRLITRDN